MQAADTLSRTFAALADPTRRAILSRLKAGPATMGELAAPFAMSRPAVSQHVKVLHDAGLVERQVQAQWRTCTLRPAPLEEAERWVEEHRAAWTTRFDQLDDHLARTVGTGRRTPPEAGRPMSAGSRQFTIVRTFDAPRAVVWRAWTDPTVAAEWWHPGGMRTPPDSVTIDLRQGGSFSYTMVGPDGTGYPTVGVYLEVREPDRLRFTWGNPGDEPAEMPVITVDLRETADGRTEMTFHVDGVEGRPGDENVYDGWTEAFAILDRRLTRR